MGFWDWKYVPSDLADWFDAEDEKHWAQHDEWLAKTVLHGESRPVFVLAAQFHDRMATMPQRVQSTAASSVVDLLRLGSDIDFSAGWSWGNGKGALMNALRLAMVVPPAAAAVRAVRGAAGMWATSRLAFISEAKGACAYTSVNNVLSYSKGWPKQVFATVEQIIEVRGENAGIGLGALHDTTKVAHALKDAGVTWDRLIGLETIDAVLQAARGTDRPIVFGIKWMKGAEQKRHALTAVRDGLGRLRILDYVPEGSNGFRGFGSLAEMASARPAWGPGFLKAELVRESPVMAFHSSTVRLLEFIDGRYRWGLPLVVGLQWLVGHTTEERLAAIAQSAWRFLQQKLGDEVPTPPAPAKRASLPADVQPPAASPAPLATGLGVAPLAPEAAAAPRIDWLTGVQYRLKFLGYYRGAVHGVNDQATKRAVLAFQKAWFVDPKEWDAIPGPVTQTMLYRKVGW